MDYEIGHVNLSIPGNKKDHKNSDDDGAIVGWHRDSYPFVCVLMMSDTTNMVGGETALRTGTGEIRKVRGPSKVHSSPSIPLPHLTAPRDVPLFSKVDTSITRPLPPSEVKSALQWSPPSAPVLLAFVTTLSSTPSAPSQTSQTSTARLSNTTSRMPNRAYDKCSRMSATP